MSKGIDVAALRKAAQEVGGGAWGAFQIDPAVILALLDRLENLEVAHAAWEPVRARKLNAKPAAITAGKTKAGIDGAVTPTPALPHATKEVMA